MMTDYVQAHWLALGAALLAVLLLAWLLSLRARRTRVRERRPDVLDPGSAPARRNQALIDAPIAATIVPPTGGAAARARDDAASFAAASPPPENSEALDWEGAERAEEQRALGAAAGAAPGEGAAPAAAPSTAPAAAAPAGTDDLSRMKGIGPKLVAALGALGITRYAQIAGWTDADIDRVDAQLGSFSGRIRRDAWVDQARLLASGDVSGFEARFGRV